jgi:hypothetical protein
MKSQTTLDCYYCLMNQQHINYEAFIARLKDTFTTTTLYCIVNLFDSEATWQIFVLKNFRHGQISQSSA